MLWSSSMVFILTVIVLLSSLSAPSRASSSLPLISLVLEYHGRKIGKVLPATLAAATRPTIYSSMSVYVRSDQIRGVPKMNDVYTYCNFLIWFLWPNICDMSEFSSWFFYRPCSALCCKFAFLLVLADLLRPCVNKVCVCEILAVRVLRLLGTVLYFSLCYVQKSLVVIGSSGRQQADRDRQRQTDTNR